MRRALLLALALAALARPALAGTADDLLRDDAGVVAGGLDPFTLAETHWKPDGIRFVLASPDATIEVRLAARGVPLHGATGREQELRWYHVLVTVTPGDAAAQHSPTIDELLRRIAANEDIGPRLRATPSRPPGQGPPRNLAPVHEDPPGGPGLVAELVVAGGLGVVALLLLPMILAGAIRTLCDGLSRPERLALATVATLVLAAHLLAPSHLVTVFHGYGTVVEAAALRPVPKYGAGSTVLYGPLLNLLGMDLRVIVATNTLCGLLSVPLLAAVARRLGGRHAGVVAVALVGLTAALVSDRLSESTLVPARLWLAATAVALDAWLRDARPTLAAAVVTFAALTLASRADLAPLLALVGCAILLANGGLRDRWAALTLLGLVALLLVPRAVTLLSWFPQAAQRGDLPGVGEPWAPLFARGLVERNALLSPWIFPPLTALLAASALALPRPHRGARALVALGTLAVVALSLLDLPAVSIPRVQAPAMEWACVLAACPLGALLERSRVHLLGGALLAGALIPAPDTVRSLWAPTNAQELDAWWRRAARAVPPTTEPRCYVALGMSDPPRDTVFRHYPLYELLPLSPEARVLNIGSFLRDADWLLAGHCEVIYVRGPQCSARERPPLAPPPPAIEHPRCAELEAAFALSPLDEAIRPNHGSPDFPFWSAQPALRYGIYRVTGRAAPPRR